MSGKKRERNEDNEDDHEVWELDEVRSAKMLFMVGCFAEALIYRPRYLYGEALETHPLGAILLVGNFN